MRPDAPFPCWTAPSVSPSQAPQLQDDVSQTPPKPSKLQNQVERGRGSLVMQQEKFCKQVRLDPRHGVEREAPDSRSGAKVHQVERSLVMPNDEDGKERCSSLPYTTWCQSSEGPSSSLYLDTKQHAIHTTMIQASGATREREKVSQPELRKSFSLTQPMKLVLTSSGPIKLDPETFSDTQKGLGVSHAHAISELQKGSGFQNGGAQKQWQLHEHLPTFAKEMIAGGVAGAVAKTAVAPLERVKILFQTNLGDFARAGVGGSLRRIFRTEGPLGFFKGNGATVLRVVPYAALHFMTYEQYRRWLVQTTGHSSPPIDLVAGSLSGATAVFFTYPLDLIRTRLAWQVSGPSNVHSAAKGAASVDNIRGVFLEIVRQEGGLRGLYKGIAPTLYGILPYAGLKFYIYEMMKLAIVRATDEQPSLVTKLGCGGVAGIIGQTLTYPLDVVRRQMQVQGAPADVAPRGAASGLPAQHYKDTWDGLRTIVRKQGWRHLYAGLSINYLKMVPSVAIGFTVYEAMKAWLQVPPREKGSRTAVAVT